MNAVMAETRDEYVEIESPSEASDRTLSLPQKAPAPPKPKCSRCHGRGLIRVTRVVGEVETKHDIECPSCHPKAESVRTQLTAIEARRVARASRMIQAAVTVALRENRSPSMIADPKRRMIDRIMQRWAVGHGSGLPPDDVGALAARPPPLDPPTQNVIDDIITEKVPDSVRVFVCEWYRTEKPCNLMALQRHISIRTLYSHWEYILEYLRQLFLLTEHGDLVTMVRSVPD